MENGEGNIESKFAGMVVSDTNNINSTDGLFQVMKAVEAAEATIKQQNNIATRVCSWKLQWKPLGTKGLRVTVISTLSLKSYLPNTS
ncbi:Hypothetical predicted protein [Olea europaea subsp. europaea]|uniref:Uncharacterized protein n=1 Tax=Olea europaea subsp. europaea TaxID=158383 RepID=A0A8S0VHC8_OLEEU|nr:Hypothetical predicted protein [Olea europaea subsp. europaea]